MLFQKDYWKMDDGELEKIALKHNIGAAVSGPDAGYDRDYAINRLVARDQALRVAVSSIGAIVSIVATLINLGMLF